MFSVIKSGMETAMKDLAVISNNISNANSTGFKKTVVFSGINEMLNDLNDNGFQLYIATNKRNIPTNKIINYSRRCLSKNGILFLENGTGQTNNISAYLELNDFTDIRVHIDYNGHDRFTSSRINNG